MASYRQTHESNSRSSHRHDSVHSINPAFKDTHGASRTPLAPRPWSGEYSDYARQYRNHPTRSVYFSPTAVDAVETSRLQIREDDDAVSTWKVDATGPLIGTRLDGDIPFPGSVDQIPCIDEVTDREKNRYNTLFRNPVKRSTYAAPTPNSSEDESVRRARRRPSKLRTDLDAEVPELTKRNASPYAYRSLRASGDQFLSPDTLHPSSASTKRQRKGLGGSISQPSSPGRNGRYRSASKDVGDYFSDAFSKDDSVIDDARYDNNVADATPDDSTFYSPSSGIPRGIDRRPMDQRSSFSRPTDGLPLRRPHLEARRKTDSVGSLPTLSRSGEERSPRPAPLTPTWATGTTNHMALRSTQEDPRVSTELPFPQSRQPSRNVSPSVSTTRSPRSPPRSPRGNGDFFDESTSNLAGSRASSFVSSFASSNLSSPSSRTPHDTPRLPKTELEWSEFMTAAKRSKASSRLASSTHQVPEPDSTKATGRQSYASYGNDLPHSVKDESVRSRNVFDEEHRRGGESKSSLNPADMIESKTLSRTVSPVRSNTSCTSSELWGHQRPSLPHRYSTSNVHESEQQESFVPTRPKANESKRVSFNESDQFRKDIQALLKKPLPECNRVNPIAGRDDWYSLNGVSSLHFCPRCVDNVFEGTAFRPAFRKSLIPPYSQEIQCALGGMPWIRAAWLLTLRQKRTDFKLVKDIAEIEEQNDPCPGRREPVQSGYGILNDDDKLVRGFHICTCDKRKIERLLPTLSGLFVRLSDRGRSQFQPCCLSERGHRFPLYLSTLVDAHEKASSQRYETADLNSLIKVIDKKSRLPDCRRNRPVVDGKWHKVGGHPYLTACEACYDYLVEPEVLKSTTITTSNSDGPTPVAHRFSRRPEYFNYDSHGTTCQFYAPYMRQVFRDAVRDDNNFNYLAKTVKRRREDESHARSKAAEIQRKINRLSRESGSESAEEEEKALDRRKAEVWEKWKGMWE